MSVSNLSDSFIQTLSEILDAGRPIRKKDVKTVAKIMKQFSSFTMDKRDIKKFFYGARVYFVFLNRYAEQSDETNCRQQVTVRMALRVFLSVVENTRFFDNIIKKFIKCIDVILEKYSSQSFVKEYLRVYSHILDEVSEEVLRRLAAKFKSLPTFHSVVKNTGDTEMQAIVIEIIFKLFKFDNIQDLKEVFPEIVQVADVSSVDMNNIYHSIRMVINKLNETSRNIFSINCSAMELDSQKVVDFEMANTVSDIWLDFNLIQEKLSFFCAKSFLSSLGNFNVYPESTWEVLSFLAKDVLKTDFNYNTSTENLEISMKIKTSSFELLSKVKFDTFRTLNISVSRYSDRFDKLVKVVLPKIFEYTFSEENFTEKLSGSSVTVEYFSKSLLDDNVFVISSEDEEHELSGAILKKRKINRLDKDQRIKGIGAELYASKIHLPEIAKEEISKNTFGTISEPVLENEFTENTKNVKGNVSELPKEEDKNIEKQGKINNNVISIVNKKVDFPSSQKNEKNFYEIENESKRNNNSTLVWKDHMANAVRTEESATMFLEEQIEGLFGEENESNLGTGNRILNVQEKCNASSEPLSVDALLKMLSSQTSQVNETLNEGNRNNIESDMLPSKFISLLESDDSNMLLKNKCLITTNKQSEVPQRLNTVDILTVNRDVSQRYDKKILDVDRSETRVTNEQKLVQLNKNFENNIALENKKKPKRALYNPDDLSHLNVTITKNYLESRSNDVEVLFHKTPVKIKSEDKTYRSRIKLTREDICGYKRNKVQTRNHGRLGRLKKRHDNDTTSRRNKRNNKKTKINIISNVLIQGTSGVGSHQDNTILDHCCPDLVRMINRSFLDFIKHVQRCNPELLKSEECRSILNILQNY